MVKKKAAETKPEEPVEVKAQNAEYLVYPRGYANLATAKLDRNSAIVDIRQRTFNNPGMVLVLQSRANGDTELFTWQKVGKKKPERKFGKITNGEFQVYKGKENLEKPVKPELEPEKPIEPEE